MATFNSILFAAGAISLICGAGAWIYRLVKPVGKAVENVDETAHIKETVNLLCECELAIMNNIITGNNVANLKSTRDKLQEYVCNH